MEPAVLNMLNSQNTSLTGQVNWRTSAACQGLPLHSVFAVQPSEAAEALRACNQCSVRRECEAVVDPANTWFDGVSGGRLWRNGREVKLRSPLAAPAPAPAPAWDAQ
jgi:WhiB family redox-sensing transcriptional regulator